MPSEQRAVSRYLMRDGSVATPRHHAIYRAMLDHPTSTDRDLVRQFKYPSSQRFAADKHQTYMEILAALKQYYYRRHDDLAILDELHLIRVLREKGMYREADKRMRSALQRAREIQDLELQLLLEREARTLFYPVLKQSRWQHMRKAMWDRVNKIVDLARNRYQYVDLHMRINEVKLVEGSNRGQADEVVDRILKHPLMKGERYALSSIALDSFYTVKRTAADLLGNIDLELEAARAQATRVLESPDDPSRPKLKNILNLTLYCDTVVRSPYGLDEFYYRCRDTARSLAARSDYRYIKTSANRYILLTYCYDIIWCLRNSDYQGLAARVEAADKAIVDFADSMTGQTRSSTNLIVGQGHLALAEFDAAINNFQVLIQEGESLHRDDWFHAATILDLVANYEKGNRRHVEYRCLALKRKFRNKRAPHKAEKTVLKYLSKLCNSPDIPGYDREIWTAFEKELEPLAADLRESLFFQEFHLIRNWIHRRPVWVTETGSTLNTGG